MKVFMVATDEPFVSKMDKMDEFGNAMDLTLYATRELAEAAAEYYSRECEIYGEKAWVVEFEVQEPVTNGTRVEQAA